MNNMTFVTEQPGKWLRLSNKKYYDTKHECPYVGSWLLFMCLYLHHFSVVPQTSLLLGFPRKSAVEISKRITCNTWFICNTTPAIWGTENSKSYICSLCRPRFVPDGGKCLQQKVICNNQKPCGYASQIAFLQLHILQWLQENTSIWTFQSLKASMEHVVASGGDKWQDQKPHLYPSSLSHGYFFFFNWLFVHF